MVVCTHTFFGSRVWFASDPIRKIKYEISFFVRIIKEFIYIFWLEKLDDK